MLLLDGDDEYVMIQMQTNIRINNVMNHFTDVFPSFDLEAYTIEVIVFNQSD